MLLPCTPQQLSPCKFPHPQSGEPEERSDKIKGAPTEGSDWWPQAGLWLQANTLGLSFPTPSGGGQGGFNTCLA